MRGSLLNGRRVLKPLAVVTLAAAALLAGHHPIQAESPATAGTVEAISAGSFSTCAIQNGGAWCWGHNGSGELGKVMSRQVV